MPTPRLPLRPPKEFIFLITQELKLDPLVGYHAIELLQRYKRAAPFLLPRLGHYAFGLGLNVNDYFPQVHGEVSHRFVEHTQP